jgi:hypothetical protein
MKAGIVKDIRDVRGRREGRELASLVEIEPLWTVHDVAAFLRVPVQTVYAWRVRGEGPRGRRVGKYLRYRPADVIAWFENGAA